MPPWGQQQKPRGSWEGPASLPHTAPAPGQARGAPPAHVPPYLQFPFIMKADRMQMSF